MKGANELVAVFVNGIWVGKLSGAGGYGGIIDYGNRVRKFWGARSSTTSNRMELMAAIRGLERIPRGSKIQVCTDCKYPAGRRYGGS